MMRGKKEWRSKSRSSLTGTSTSTGKWRVGFRTESETAARFRRGYTEVLYAELESISLNDSFDK